MSLCGVRVKAKQHEIWRKGFPYYKVQYRDNKLQVWRDVQKRFPTLAVARQHGEQLIIGYRVMELTLNGRKVIYDATAKKLRIS